jgi:hypothetical protein
MRLGRGVPHRDIAAGGHGLSCEGLSCEYGCCDQRG